MQPGNWKFAVLAGVVGVGLLLVLQAQQSLDQVTDWSVESVEPQAELAGSSTADTSSSPAPDGSSDDPFAELNPEKAASPNAARVDHDESSRGGISFRDLPTAGDVNIPDWRGPPPEAYRKSQPNHDFRPIPARSNRERAQATDSDSPTEAMAETPQAPSGADPFAEIEASQPASSASTDPSPAADPSADLGADPFATAAPPATLSVDPSIPPLETSESAGSTTSAASTAPSSLPLRDRQRQLERLAAESIEPDESPKLSEVPARRTRMDSTSPMVNVSPNGRIVLGRPVKSRDFPAERIPLAATEHKAQAPRSTPPTFDESSEFAGGIEQVSGVELPRNAARPRDPVRDGTPSASTAKATQQPRLIVEKQAPAKAVVGQPFDYSIIVQNLGTNDARDVVIEDQLPKGAELKGAEPVAEMTDRRMFWQLGTLRPNETRKIRVRLLPTEEGRLGTVAKVNFTAEVATDIAVSAPQLAIEAQAPPFVKLGEMVQLNFRITNTGKTEADGVELVGVVPAGLQHPAGANIKYEIGQLQPGESIDVQLELAAAKSGRAAFKAMLTAGGVMAADKPLPIDVVSEQFTLTRKGPQRAYAGRSIEFKNVIKNVGPVDVKQIHMTETVPAGFEFEEASDRGRYDKLTRMITWTIPELRPEEELAVSVRLKARAAGDLTSQVVAGTALGASARVEPAVRLDGIPALTLEPVSDQRTVGVGEDVTIRIQLDNRGAALASRVVLEANIPPEFEFRGAKGPGHFERSGARVRFEEVATLDTEGQSSYELKLRAMKPGDSHVELAVTADHLRTPLRRDEAIQIVP